ncbi:ABC transporter permease [Falsihalocynthiibacter arcticus]|uniref:ABC transporter permease n=1 Tax=Falsihalocynthiibacter arcticus TaxID=1579316 RepID=A0A126V214_9RHOB|nr:ABC transporter permease [Falsihalocynthiibacter arcticus]AML52362.1 hypothetical protein RC74_14725 [Falsihalocynthiibacter arcticus]
MTPDIGFDKILIAALFLLINGGISLALSLGIGRSLLIAGVRMVVQLVLLAFVLRWIFEVDSIAITLVAMIVMGGFAGYEVLLRQAHPAGRLWTASLGTTVMLSCGFLITLPTLAVIVQAEPWFSPRVALPMFGMIAGSAMGSIALTLHVLSHALIRDALIIEARLSMGESKFQALGPTLRTAIRSGLLPTVTNMASIGVVSIPGMMTGQILANADPLTAAKYQMVIMFLISATSALGAVAAAYALAWRVTDQRHRLRLDRLRGV